MQLYRLIPICLLTLAVACSLVRWRGADRATRVFIATPAFTLFAEAIALACAYLFHYNLIVYRILAPFELLGYCLYFHFSFASMQRLHAGWILGGIGLIAAIGFELAFPNDIFGNRFLITESVTIICLCLYAFYAMLVQDEMAEPTRYVHFWLVAILVFYKCFSFLSFALYNPTIENAANHALLTLIHVANIGTFIAVILTFVYLPKLKSSTR